MTNLKLCYEIFHLESKDPERNKSYENLNLAVSEIFPRLGSATVDLTTRKKVYDFCTTTPGFNFNFTDRWWGHDQIFPHKCGVVGVWASNFNAWKKLLETDYDAVVIFEDDAEITEDFYETLQVFLKELPEDWDIFSFFPHKETRRYVESVYAIEGNEYVCHSYQANCCAGYIINKSGVRKALEEIEKNPINAPVDWFVFDAYWKAYREHGYKKIFNSYTIKPGSPEIAKFTIKYNLETSFIHNTEDMKFST